MPEALEKYACDTCRARKVACSRERFSCQRCKVEKISCLYSRTGVIRRNRKRKAIYCRDEIVDTPESYEHRDLRHETRPTSEELNSTTHERLQRLAGRDHPSLREMASLLEEYNTAWQGSEAFDKLAEGAIGKFYKFAEEQSRTWAHMLNASLQRENLAITSVPLQLYNDFTTSNLEEFPDQAWLVMFYCTGLRVVRSTTPEDALMLDKLRKNLWLAFNNARLLLEPKLSSIQALIMLTSVEEFMTPSLCWSLISKACVMLQALNVDYRRPETAVQERRSHLFWQLNVMDQAFSLMLCRPPTFHPDLVDKIAMPPLNQLLRSGAQSSSTSTPSLFDAHYTHQMHLLSIVMGEIWSCLYGSKSQSMEILRERLDTWYSEATKILDATAIAEKPFRSISDVAAVDVGLCIIHLHYHSFTILLTVSCKNMRTQRIAPAQQLLELLPHLGDLIVEPNEPYNCTLWQLLHCPMAAFGTLWGQIVTQGRANTQQSLPFLEAIENLPPYLGKLSPRNSLVGKMQHITERIVQHARIILHSEDGEPTASYTCNMTEAASDSGRTKSMRDSSIPDSMPATQLSSTIDVEYSVAHGNELSTWSDDNFLDVGFDWFSWSNQTFS